MARRTILPVWKSHYRVQGLDADLMSLAKVSALCNYFQESAGQHADHLGVGYAALLSKGMVWILSRLRIQIEAYPILGEEIVLETWPAGIDGLFALRSFTIARANGQKVIKGTSAWLVIEKVTRKPLRDVSVLLKNIPENPFYAGEDIDIPKVRPVQGLTKTGTVTARYSDLDANAHVNNNRYIEWTMNAFDAEWYRTRRIHDLAISFLNELHAGNTLDILKVQTGQDIWQVEGHSANSGEIVFRSLVSFTDYF